MNNDSGTARIKVIGVGGGGNNAVNRMIDAKITSAEFVAVNTDFQALKLSLAPTKVQIGAKLTGGLGAGANPDVGKAAAEESSEALREVLKDVDMLFITAGMGGGTGTGAAPIIARMAHEKGILTVAVVTKPFHFEGRQRMLNAERGIESLREYVDTLVVVPNQKLLDVLPPDTPMVDAFIHADDVLRNAIRGISDLIVMPSMINLDFADVRSIMQNKGFAHMGIGVAEGPDKTINAVRQAVMSPLLETNIGGANGVILNIVGGVRTTLSEINLACEKVKEAVSENANIIFGAGIDETLGDQVMVTLIATGFDYSGQPTTVGRAQAAGVHAMPNKQMSNAEFEERFAMQDQSKTQRQPEYGYQQPSARNPQGAPVQQQGYPTYQQPAFRPQQGGYPTYQPNAYPTQQSYQPGRTDAPIYPDAPPVMSPIPPEYRENPAQGAVPPMPSQQVHNVDNGEDDPYDRTPSFIRKLLRK